MQVYVDVGTENKTALSPVKLGGREAEKLQV